MAKRLADLRTPFGRLLPAVPPAPAAARPAAPAAPPRRRLSGDIVIGGAGILLGLTCALFPWYIFFNPEKFGVRPVVFAGNDGPPPDGLTLTPQRIDRSGNLPAGDASVLDFFPTGTVGDSPVPALAGEAQPFPGDKAADAAFSLVHVANGRALIRDRDGLWVVTVGSPLPDDTRVAAIEERGGAWVLVTSADKVVPLTR